jgi:hypothetical protein
LESTRTPTFRTEIVVSEAISEAPPRASVLERGLLIGGNSVPASSGRLADDISPWDGEVYARVAAGTPADITRAADAAEAAFPSWSTMGAFERREIFLKAADVMAQRGEETSDAVKLSSCVRKFSCGGGESGGFVVFAAGGQAVVEAAEEAAEQVALGGGVPVAGVFAAVVVGAGAG